MFKQTNEVNKQWYRISCSNCFPDASNSSDIEEEIIKQANTVKPFDMEPSKTIPKKPFVSEEENNWEEKLF